MDGVVRRAGALRKGLVGDIDGVGAALLDDGRPDGAGARLVRAAGGLARRAEPEGIVGEGVGGLGVGEAFAGIGPDAPLGVASAVADLSLARALEAAVIVADDLAPLDVPLARRHHVGAGVLEHRDQQREHEGRGEHVLDGAVQGGALPGPEVLLLVVVASVALPEGDVAVGQAPGETARAHLLDEAGMLLARVRGLESVVGRPAVGAQCGGGEFFEFVAVGNDLAGGVVLRHLLEFLGQLALEPLHVGRVPGVVGQVGVEGEVEGLPGRFDLGHGKPVPHRGPPLQAGGKRVAHHAKVAGAGDGLALRRQDGENQEDGGQEGGAARHSFFILETSMMKTSTDAMPTARQSAPKSLKSFTR